MARRAEGWKLRTDSRSGIISVRFTYAGLRYELSTGSRDSSEAAETAARFYAEVISGRRVRGRQVKRAPADIDLEVLFARWLADIESSLDKDTIEVYEIYAATHWLPFFGSLDRITARSIEDYWRRRLGRVARGTVLKELSVLGGFLGWCKGVYIEEVPPFAMPPATALGNPRYQRKPIALLRDEVEQLLSHLPEWIQPGRRVARPFAVRARFEVAWETGLRPETLDTLRTPDNYQAGAKVLELSEEQDKTRFARTVPLTPRARAALDRVCPEVGLIFGAHDYRSTLRAAALAAGFPIARVRAITSQCFRHSRLTYWGEVMGHNLVGIQYLAGHKHATTTERYLKPSLRAAQAVLEGSDSGGISGGHGKRGGAPKRVNGSKAK